MKGRKAGKSQEALEPVGEPVVVFQELATENGNQGRAIIAEDPLISLRAKIQEYGARNMPEADSFMIGSHIIIRELKEFVLGRDRIRAHRTPFVVCAIQYCKGGAQVNALKNL
ncbi:MAG: hypothetical protein HY518_02245 [Candidatus Aenigmarchaeota archaeon]|nr:hypothetical protein [Candidatus Aenigmarchaeota archaeon]